MSMSFPGDGFPKAQQQNDPAAGATVIDYSGGNQTITRNVRGVYIGTGGNLNVIMVDGTTALFSNLVAGQIYPFRIRTVLQASSNAAGVLLH